jgi:hypothetical protein
MSELFLRIDIQNEKPVDLNVLSNSLNALASQYDVYLKRELRGEYPKKEQRKLLVKEIKKGSIIIDLVGTITPMLPEINSICEFGTYLKNTFDFFLNKGEKNMNTQKKIVKILEILPTLRHVIVVGQIQILTFMGIIILCTHQFMFIMVQRQMLFKLLLKGIKKKN